MEIKEENVETDNRNGNCWYRYFYRYLHIYRLIDVNSF